ncbi:MAG: fused MFS/spermidine synthase [Planctomycetes bacterium]|nr:fused MFS/spermidine synthase [Planctomycetota bacterium]
MRRLAVLLLFFLSGAAGLIYQVAWMRRLTLIFGVTAEAVSTVLAVFMGGLALGSWLLGRAGDDTRAPLRFYGWLELGIALFGFQSVILLDGLMDSYVSLRRTGALPDEWLPLLRFFLACAALIGPTTLMGGTLPVLIRAACRARERIARAAGLFYAINTLGAVAGTLFCAFFLVRVAGIQNAIFTAAAINFAVGLAALWLARGQAPSAAAAPPDPSPLLEVAPVPALAPAPATSGTVRAVVFAFGVSGFLALAYEVLWTRYLIYVVRENSVYAFSMMLAAFLLGIVAGSLIASWLGDRIKDLVAFFGGVQVLIGAAAFATVAAMGLIADTRWWGSDGFWTGSAIRFGRCLAVLFVPCTLSGTTFAIVAKVYARRVDTLGRDAGIAYAVNTLGAILGAIAGGFLVLPLLKLRAGLVVLGAMNVLIGLWLLLRRRPEGRARKTAIVTGILAAAGLASVFWAGDPARKALEDWAEKIVFYEDGRESSVAIVQAEESEDLHLLVDGDGQAGTGIGMQIHLRLLGHLPAFFHPNPREALCVCFGAGISLGSLAQHPVERVDIVELSRAVITGAKHFAPFNHDPLHDPKVTLTIDDGRNFLLASDRKYDVITSDPVDPDDAGVTSLYSREYYELVRDHLNEGGVACQWLAGYGAEETKLLMRTFQSVFPNASLWFGEAMILVGLKGEPRATLADLRARFTHAPVRDSLAVIGVTSPEELLALRLLGPQALRSFVGAGPLNTDDRPLIEYLGPRTRWSEDDDQDVFWQALTARRDPDMSDWLAGWTPEDQAAVAPAWQWTSWILERQHFEWGGSDWRKRAEEKNLSAEEKDRRYLAREKERAEKRAHYLETTWKILGSPVSKVHLVMTGLGRDDPRDETVEARRRYEEEIAAGCAAWGAGEVERARERFVVAAEARPQDKRATVMRAACLLRGDDLLGALRAMLSFEPQGEERWFGVAELRSHLVRHVFDRMEGMSEEERAAAGRVLLEVTPADEERPESSDAYPWLEDEDRGPPKPRPTAENAGAVDAWRLWYRDAARDLTAKEGAFTWRKDEEEKEDGG